MKKLNDSINSNTKLINDLSGEVKLIYIIELTKDSRNRYGILHFAKNFVKDG